MYTQTTEPDDALACFRAQPNADKWGAIRLYGMLGGPATHPVDPAALAEVIAPGDCDYAIIADIVTDTVECRRLAGGVVG